MSNGIKAVRQSIKQRKNVRLKNRDMTPTPLPLIATFEEKHGFDSIHPDLDTEAVKQPKSNKKKILNVHKSIGVTLIFFFLCMFLLQTNSAFFMPAQSKLESALNKEFPFAKVTAWYNERFGPPLALTPTNAETNQVTDQLVMPVTGDVIETFVANGRGIMIAPEAPAIVKAIDSGVVIFAGNDKVTNKTIVVQHADESISTYGYLTDIDVFLYQYVSPEHTLGEFHPTSEMKTLYFSIEKESEYIDPAQVIPVDLQP